MFAFEHMHEILTAIENGKSVERRITIDSPWQECNVIFPDFQNYEYRIKSEAPILEVIELKRIRIAKCSYSKMNKHYFIVVIDQDDADVIEVQFADFDYWITDWIKSSNIPQTPEIFAADLRKNKDKSPSWIDMRFLLET